MFQLTCLAYLILLYSSVALSHPMIEARRMGIQCLSGGNKKQDNAHMAYTTELTKNMYI